MTKISHKYADVIKAWADGEDIQWKHTERDDWIDHISKSEIDLSNPNVEWRIKPAHYSGKFRVAFYRGIPGYSDYNLYIVHEQFVKEAEQDELFVQWLTHWVEFNVEVPVEK